MTTTLRPVAPEAHGEDGSRSRSYGICDNGRPVGTVDLATENRYGVLTGRIVHLAVDGPDRRRGRATVGVLAAEEVLRGWGCRSVRAAVPVGAGDTRRLAAALGYSERNRTMVKQLTEAPALPSGSAVRPLTGDGYPAWRERDAAVLRQILTTDGVPDGLVEEQIAAAHRRLLPDGPSTAGMVMRSLVRDGRELGTLWLRTDGAPGTGAHAWVYGVEVDGAHRGRGHGHTLMLAAERECLAASACSLGLNVYADNAPARRLYDRLGYRTVQLHLHKRLL